MVELVDTYALGAYAARCAGSNPVPGTRSQLFEKSSHKCAFFSLIDKMCVFTPLFFQIRKFVRTEFSVVS